MTGVSFKVTAETSQADARLAAIDKTLVQIKGSANSLSNSLSNAFKSIAATVGLSAIALQLKSASDSAIQLENRMKTIADSSQGVADAMRTVRDLSMETRSAVDSTAELYQKYSKAAEQLAASSEEVLSVTRLTQQAIQLSGTSADSANAAVIQLGQGLGSGVLRGEELNSVLEQTPRLAQAIAQGLNIGVGQLRAMGAAGQLTSEAVFNSLLSQADQLNDEFARTTFTMTSQITNIKTALGVFTSEALKGVGEGGLGKLLGVVSEKIYARSDTIQTEVNKFVSSISLRLSSIKDLGSAMFDVGAALYRNFAVALPVIGYTRTALGDVYQDLRNIAGMLKSVFREPFAQLMEGAREADVFLKTGFGLFDWKVPAAMRDLFKAKSLIDFTEGLKKLASGVDSNTTFITNRLSSIPRALKYGFEDALIYVGILNKPFTMRMGYFEPLLDSLGEIKTGLIDGTKWAASFSGSLTPLGKIFGSLGGIIRNTAYLLYIAFASIAGVVGGLVTVLDQVLVRVVAFTRAFADNNTFSDIFESSQKYLGRALRNIEDFAKNVINEFFQIWDAVIGHSWWTDTIASIIDTSNSLWDKAGSGLSRFAKNTKNTFKGIYEDRPIGDMYDSGKKMLASAVVDLKIRVGEIDFIDIAKKTKDALVQAFNNLRENYKNILETAGIGLLFMGIVSLFPGAAIAQMISAKAVIAISAGLLVGSDRIIQQITGNSPLGEIAATMGEVLGRSLYRFITNIPHLLNAVMSAFTGLFRGFVSQLPMHIGDIAGAFLNIPVMGDIMGFVGALFFGKSVLGFLNTVGLVKLKAADIVTAFSRLFAIMPASPTGLVYKALFGPSAAGIIGLLMLINGGFDSLLGNSTLAKLIAGGGLAALIVRGMNAQNQGNTGNPSGTFFAGILQSLGKAKTALTGWGNSLMNMWAGVMNPPPISPSAILTPLQFMLLKVKAEIRAFIIGTQLVWGQMVMWMGVQWSRMTSFVSIQWGRMMAYMTATAAGGGFLATLSKGFLGIGAAATAGFGMASTALTGFWAKTMLFMKTPAFKYVALITGAMLATAIIAPEARAGEVPGEGNKATAAGASDGMTIIKDESPGIFSRMADWIIEAFETGMHFVSENFQAILLTVTLAGSTIMSIVTPIFTSIGFFEPSNIFNIQNSFRWRLRNLGDWFKEQESYEDSRYIKSYSIKI